MSLEKLLELIMAVPFPKEGNPYVGMSTREDLTFNKEDNKGGIKKCLMKKK